MLNSNLLVDIIRNYCSHDNWAYYLRSKNRVSQIDCFLASKVLAARIEKLVSTEPNKTPYIVRNVIGYRELDKKGNISPNEATFVHFEKDNVTSLPTKITPGSKVNFRFSHFKEVLAEFRSNISDHCTVRVCF